MSIERLIIELDARGCSQDDIANQLHVGKHRVNNTLKLFRCSGKIPNAKKRGAKIKINSKIKEFVEIRTLLNADLTNKEMIKEISENFKIDVSTQSISNVRKEKHFRYSHPKIEQMLTQKHKEDRVTFCQKMLQDLTVLATIVFSDESRFVLGDDKKCVWVRKGEYTPSSIVTSVKFPQSVMIFGVIGVGFKSDILIVSGTIDSEKYIQNCIDIGFIEALNLLHGDFEWVFMQDGARCHTSEVSMNFLESECDVINDWPANSPDLNPIELLWAILKKKSGIRSTSK